MKKILVIILSLVSLSTFGADPIIDGNKICYEQSIMYPIKGNELLFDLIKVHGKFPEKSGYFFKNNVFYRLELDEKLICFINIDIEQNKIYDWFFIIQKASLSEAFSFVCNYA